MKRKRYTQEFKNQVVKESLEVGNAAVVARKYDVSTNMVSRWIKSKILCKNLRLEMKIF